MIAAVDVDYRPPTPPTPPSRSYATAACVVFDAWESPTSVNEWTARMDDVRDYEPGAFFKRELPCLLAVLRVADFAASLRARDVVVVDGFVFLDNAGAPGLGARLYEALERRVPIVGVAKTAFKGAPAVEVRRGKSVKPLFVSAVGVDVAEAAEHVQAMAGEYRVPTLLKRVDGLARGE